MLMPAAIKRMPKSGIVNLVKNISHGGEVGCDICRLFQYRIKFALFLIFGIDLFQLFLIEFFGLVFVPAGLFVEGNTLAVTVFAEQNEPFLLYRKILICGNTFGRIFPQFIGFLTQCGIKSKAADRADGAARYTLCL